VRTTKRERTWEKCSVCDRKRTAEKSIWCTSCGRRHHNKCVSQNPDKSDVRYCDDCGADLTKPIEKSLKSFRSVDPMAEDRLKEEIKQLTQLLAEEREENRREKAEKEAEQLDEQRQTMKRLKDFETREQEVCDQLQAERVQTKDREAQQEEVIEALKERLNRIEKGTQDHQHQGSVTERGIDSALERTSRMLSNVPRNLMRLGRT
ncbi:MAG: hypothetical protein GY820_15840, partial [Gammaproteobacteria bacterium]|nr:hypothetical protein [Gammaproteobacteria bacterium]